MDFMQYLSEQALILIPVLYIIGALIKKTPRIPDRFIPWILLVLGIIGGCALIGISVEGIIQGILVTGTTVLGNQLLKQTTQKE